MQRGDVTLWLSGDARDAWRPPPAGHHGGHYGAGRRTLSRRGLFRIAQRMLEIMLIERVENGLTRSPFCIIPHMGAVAPADLYTLALCFFFLYGTLNRTFAIVQELVDDIVLVEEEEIAKAVRTLAVEQKLVVEPGGAVGVAALLAGKIQTADRDVVCVLSGGNILPSKLAELIATGAS